MNEAEWLTSTNPAAMLAHVGGREVGGLHDPSTNLASDRKLCLWVEACRSLAASQGGWANKMDTLSEQHRAVHDWCRDGLTWAKLVPFPARAVLLRDVFGNPFRPVRLPTKRPCCPHCGAERWDAIDVDEMACLECMKRWTCPSDAFAVDCPWLTTRVRALAEAAYQERLREPCGRCKGTGSDRRIMGLPADCPDCGGKGTRDTGRLDSERLLILAEALEEDGCLDVALLRHLRGEEPCQKCMPNYRTRSGGGLGWLGGGGFGEPHFQVGCTDCGGDLNGKDGTGWRPLRGPHFRGCWVVDLILGRE